MGAGEPNLGLSLHDMDPVPPDAALSLPGCFGGKEKIVLWGRKSTHGKHCGTKCAVRQSFQVLVSMATRFTWWHFSKHSDLDRK